MKIGEKRGFERRNQEIVTNMLDKNLSDEMIADFACSFGICSRSKIESIEITTTMGTEELISKNKYKG